MPRPWPGGFKPLWAQPTPRKAGEPFFLNCACTGRSQAPGFVVGPGLQLEPRWQQLLTWDLAAGAPGHSSDVTSLEQALRSS